MKMYLASGVPHSVQMDSWWLNAERRAPPDKHGTTDGDTPRLPPRVGVLAAMVALADVLLWQAAPGLSLAVFAMAVLLAGWVMAGRRGTVGLGVALLLFLPVVERVQALSVMFWLAGLVLGAGWIALARFPGLGGSLRFLWHAPGRVIDDLRSASRAGMPGDLRGRAQRGFQGWFVPLGLGLVFLSLFISANPVLEGWLDGLFSQRLSPDFARLFFWAGLAVLVWPFLTLTRMTQRLALGINTAPRRAVQLPAMINAASVRRSLIMFNIVFAVQTLSDFAVLSGGATLPDGMSYAAYAHRGAYPLLAVALLAGVFALVARPFTRGNRLLRAALLGWMMQTLILVFSSLIRLETYVSAYGLSYLRLYALVWIGLVAVGITLVIWQILRDLPARWLLGRCAGLGMGVLYLCSFVSFAALVADYNLAHDVPRDRSYLCHLDRAALPVIVAHEHRSGTRLCTGHAPVHALPRALSDAQDWREWGFRDWRSKRSLASLEAKAKDAIQWPTF